MPKPLPTIERLRELFDYNPETGVLTRKVRAGRYRAGLPAGSIKCRGYHVTSVDQRHFSTHRLIWAIQTGAWPALEIDHRDGQRTNNCWANLRMVDRQTNVENAQRATKRSKTGLLGAFRTPHGFCSQIRARGALHRLGTFQTAAEAHAAYLKAKALYHPGYVLPANSAAEAA